MIYYTVYDSSDKKIADCGDELDAKFLANLRKGTYKTTRLKWNQTVTIEPLQNKQLPTRDIIPNQSWGSVDFDINNKQLIESHSQPIPHLS